MTERLEKSLKRISSFSDNYINSKDYAKKKYKEFSFFRKSSGHNFPQYEPKDLGCNQNNSVQSNNYEEVEKKI